MLKLSGARLCWVVLFTMLATATRAIPRVLSEVKGASSDVTSVFVVRHTSTRPATRLLPRCTGLVSLICLNPNHLELFPRFSGMLQQRTGKNRLRLLEAQRE